MNHPCPAQVLRVDYGDAYWNFERELSRLEARLTDVGFALDAAAAWAARAATLGRGRAVPAPALAALRLQFGETRKSKRPRPLSRDLFADYDSDAPQHLARPPKRPRAPDVADGGRRRGITSDAADVFGDRMNFDDSEKGKRVCASRKHALRAFLENRCDAAVAVLDAVDREVVIKCAKRRYNKGLNRGRLKAARHHDFYFHHTRGGVVHRFRSNPEVARHFGLCVRPRKSLH